MAVDIKSSRFITASNISMACMHRFLENVLKCFYKPFTGFGVVSFDNYAFTRECIRLVIPTVDIVIGVDHYNVYVRLSRLTVARNTVLGAIVKFPK